ncbi:MAG: hypothetical protein QW555_07885 [Nitrososphaerota archaeon]
MDYKKFEKFRTLYYPDGELIYEEWRGKINLPDPLFYSEVEQRIQRRKVVPPPIERWGTGDGGEILVRQYRGRKIDVYEKLWLQNGVGLGRRLEAVWRND